MPQQKNHQRTPPPETPSCYRCSRPRGAPVKNYHKTHLELLNNLKIDDSDPVIGSNNGELLLSCIFALITGVTVEINLRADHGLHDLVNARLLDSTVSASVN